MSTSLHTPQEIADQLQASYDSLCRTIGLLEVTEIETGQIEQGWTPKALMAHITFWDEYQTARMQAALLGTSAQTGFRRPELSNDERIVLDNARPWNMVWANADHARRDMIDFAHTLNAEQLAAAYPEGDGLLSLAKLLEHMVRHTRLHTQDLYRYCGSMTRWSRSELRMFLVEQHRNLMDGIGGLPESTILSAKVNDGWFIRDLLVHVLSWNEYIYLVLKQWPHADHESLTPWLGGSGVNEMNANLLAERSRLNMIDICDGLMTYHRRILSHFDQATDEQLRGLGDYGWGEEGTLSSFFYGCALHEAEHAEDIWHYRADSR